jgi:uncharacterized membrane protein YfcA
MLTYLLPAFVAFIASILTFFSGFGLGTILTPVFALFYPLDVAIGLTAIVHFLNNVFKFGLMKSHVQWKVIVLFGIPAFIAAALGAFILHELSEVNSIIQFDVLNISIETSYLQLIIGGLILFFAFIELVPRLKSVQLGEKFLIPGGVLSGFFGGLSGHQGALRSAFLIKAIHSKQAFVATGIAIALLVDITRIPIYLQQSIGNYVLSEWFVLLITLTAALAGAILGRLLLQKVTITILQQIVGWLLLTIGFLIALGLI